MSIRFGSAVKELRIHLCQNGSHSKGVRDFIEKHYVDLKLSNPKFPILIRECSNVEPKLWTRYAFGKEKCLSLANLSSEDIISKLRSLTS